MTAMLDSIVLPLPNFMILWALIAPWNYLAGPLYDVYGLIPQLEHALGESGGLSCLVHCYVTACQGKVSGSLLGLMKFF